MLLVHLRARSAAFTEPLLEMSEARVDRTQMTKTKFPRIVKNVCVKVDVVIIKGERAVKLYC